MGQVYHAAALVAAHLDVNIKTGKIGVRMDIEQGKIEEIIALIKQVHFGEVIVTIHNSEIVQVQRSERKRFKAQKRLLAQS